MNKITAEEMIKNEAHSWIKENPEQAKDPFNASLYFYTHLKENHPHLLDFRTPQGTKDRVIGVWLKEVQRNLERDFM